MKFYLHILRLSAILIAGFYNKFTKVDAQIYGEYNCNNGVDAYCGPSNFSQCTPEATQAAYGAFWGYLAGFEAGDNFSTSTSFTTGDGNEDGSIPPFQITLRLPKDIVEIAGTYTGSDALGRFFGASFTATEDFSFEESFAPHSGGVRIVAFNCQFLVAQWQENAKVTKTGETIDKALNTIVYTFLNHTYPKIARVDIKVNSADYMQQFCEDGTVQCGSGNSNGSSKSSLLVIILVCSFIGAFLLAGSVFYLRKRKNENNHLQMQKLNDNYNGA